MPIDQTFTVVSHPSVPASIHLLSMQTDENSSGRDRRFQERTDGDRLLKELLERCSGRREWVLDRRDGCKPTASLESMSAWVSLAHSPGLLVGAASLTRDIGIDVEPVQRRVPSGLARRMLHPMEMKQWGGAESTDLLRLWTLKEAALKQYGTGLKTRMTRVCVLPVRPGQFEISIADKGPVQALCWEDQDHWIALAWRETR